MDIKLSKKKKALIWELIDKYDNIYPELADALSNCLLNRVSPEDLLLISSYIDINSIEEDDFYKIESAIGSEIDLMMFNI